MERELPIAIPREAIATFCERNQIRRLALFGSVLRDDFTDESDVDVLVEFEEGKGPGYFGLFTMADELAALLGRRVDLLTAAELSPHFRSEVLEAARPLYDAA